MTRNTLKQLIRECIKECLNEDKPLTKAERAATSRKKAASNKQFVPNTEKAKVKLKEFINNIINELLENVPQKGKSSGDAIKWKSDAKVIKKDMTLDEILNNIEGVPYYKAVVVDYDNEEEYSWDLTKKVVEYAEHFKKHPESIANLPPIIVVDGELKDGAHRISAIYLLRERMDKQNPLWNKLKLKVEFGKKTDVE